MGRPSNPLEPDQAAIQRGAKLIGLQRGVHVCKVPADSLVGGYDLPDGSDMDVLGQYLGLLPNGQHHIHINERASARIATEAIWHEMIHAKQVERAGSYQQFRNEYEDAHLLGCMMAGCGCQSPRCPHGYRNNFMEVEALQSASDLSTDPTTPRLLTIPTKGVYRPRITVGDVLADKQRRGR